MKEIVAYEPFGNQELDIPDFIFEKEHSDKGDNSLFYLLVEAEGVSEIPVPEDSDIEVHVYRSLGYEVSDDEELWERNDLPRLKWEQYITGAIEWYEQRGFKAERIHMAGLISPL
jgi:hypothetical protein